MLRIDNILDRIWGGGALSDHSGFNERVLANPLAPLGQTKNPQTAFAAPSGLYQFTMMPFGLNGTTASFQRVMDKALKGVQDCVVAYIDDILVYNTT